MEYGFVYILANESMPGIYKIGCTERSPAKRALELSSSTGVPTPFEVVCYGEFESFQAIEQEMHRYFGNWRVNESREFFSGPLSSFVEHLERCCGDALSFCDIQANWRIRLEERRDALQFKRELFFGQSAEPFDMPVFAGLD